MNNPANSLFLVVLEVTEFRDQGLFLVAQSGCYAAVPLGGSWKVGGVAFDGGMEVFCQLEQHLDIRALVFQLIQGDFLRFGFRLCITRRGRLTDGAQGGDDTGNRGLAEFLFAQQARFGNIGSPAGAEGLDHQFQRLTGKAEFRRNQVASDEIVDIGAIDFLFLLLPEPRQLCLGAGQPLDAIVLNGDESEQEGNQHHNADQGQNGHQHGQPRESQEGQNHHNEPKHGGDSGNTAAEKDSISCPLKFVLQKVDFFFQGLGGIKEGGLIIPGEIPQFREHSSQLQRLHLFQLCQIPFGISGDGTSVSAFTGIHRIQPNPPFSDEMIDVL